DQVDRDRHALAPQRIQERILQRLPLGHVFPHLGYCCSGLRPLRPTRAPRRRLADVIRQSGVVGAACVTQFAARTVNRAGVALLAWPGTPEEQAKRIRQTRLLDGGIEPARVQLPAQPGQLALGELAGGEDRAVAESVLR